MFPSSGSSFGSCLIVLLFLLLLLAFESEIDLRSAFDKKLLLLEERYPVEKVRGRSDKWTEYSS